MSDLREHDLEKVSIQPVVHDPTWVDPDTDDNGARGFLLAVWCNRRPSNLETVAFNEANNRFELQSASAALLQPMLIQDESTGAWGFLTDDDGNLLYGYPE